MSSGVPQASDPTAQFAVFRAAYVCAGLLGLWLVARRPRAHALALLTIALHVCAWAAYVAPLGRLYALEQRLDRAFNVGLAACAAADGRVFEHVQVRHAAVEPFWNALLAALAGFDPERVLALYGWLAPLSLLAVGLAVYVGLRSGDEHGWEAALAVLAVLGLSSCSLGMQTPTPLFWAGNFLLKPNHAAGFALLVLLALGPAARSWWLQGLLLGLLGWVFLPHLFFGATALVLAAWFRPAGERRLGRICASLALAALLVAPDVANLWRDYAPQAGGGSAAGVWREQHMGPALANPQWLLLDAAPLCLLAALGLVRLRRRAEPRDRYVLALLGSAGLWWLAYALASPLGWSPSPDDAHYFQRFALALAAGAGLAELAARVEAAYGLPHGLGAVRVAAVCLPLTFPAYWDPPTMDRYYALSRPSVPGNVLDAGAWVRSHTAPGTVFAGGEQSATWLPVLAGRRVLLSAGFRPPADYARRRAVERILLTSPEPSVVRAAAAEYGVTHLALDADLRATYGAPSEGLYEPLFRNEWVEILRLR